MKYYGFLFISFILFSCSDDKKQEQQVDVHSLNQQFISAWNTKDTAKINSFLADDVQFLQAHTHFKGKGEVAQKWVAESLAPISNLKTSVISSGTTDVMAYEAGTFSVDVKSSGEPDAFGEGNYIFLWKKTNAGNWRLAYAQLEDLPLQYKNQP